MRVFTVIANLGWNLPRFLRQIGWLVLGLAGLCALAFATILYFWLYFDFDDPKAERPIEITAAKYALSVPNDARPCYRSDFSPENISCYVPFSADRRHCRWWLMEPCRSFMAEHFILNDPDKLGKVINALMYPRSNLPLCLHSKPSTSDDHGPCHESPPLNPIVIEFVGDKKNVIMRID